LFAGGGDLSGVTNENYEHIGMKSRMVIEFQNIPIKVKSNLHKFMSQSRIL